ncbi:MAG: adenylyltransferase/cytidyltransferase family protein [Candidatus Woesearchaeota archaeon]
MNVLDNHLFDWNNNYANSNSNNITPINGDIRRALYIGRFQMLHNGHLEVLKFIESQNDVDEIVIGIGSSQYSRYNKSFEAPLLMNPFTFEERKGYIERVFNENIIKPYKIFGIMDQHDHDRWVKHTFTVVPKIRYIYTNSRGEIDAFTKAGYECRQFPLSTNYNATLIRELIANDGPWEKYVPSAVSDVIKEKELDKIVKELFNSNKLEVEAIHKNRIRRGELSYEDFLIQENLRTK